MAIYLIRHGETPLNRARVIQQPDTPLSDQGIAQARGLARRLRGEGIVHILSSDMARAAMTAGCVAEATGLEVEHDALLQERNFGDIRGTPYAELDENPFGPDYAPPGGEDWPSFHERVDRAWDRVCVLAARIDGHLAVVSHGLVLHSIAAHHIELPAGVERPAPNGPPLHLGNTALSILSGPSPWRAELFGCTAHLDGELVNDPRGISGL
jgi:probable phosphoglycerate mutase